MLVDGDYVDEGGISELRAREIHLLPGYQARMGCLNHIVADNLNVSCSDIATTDLKSASISNVALGLVTNQSTRAKFIELAIQHSAGDWSFKAVPNPSSGTFTINFSGTPWTDEPVLGEVIDRLGRTVKSLRLMTSTVEVTLPEVPPGVYTLRIKAMNTVQSCTIVLL